MQFIVLNRYCLRQGFFSNQVFSIIFFLIEGNNKLQKFNVIALSILMIKN